MENRSSLGDFWAQFCGNLMSSNVPKVSNYCSISKTLGVVPSIPPCTTVGVWICMYVWGLASKVFLRLLNSFDTIVRREISTALQKKPQKQISKQLLVCLPFMGRNIFLPMADDQTVSIIFCFNSAECAGNFAVYSPEVSLRIISFRCLFGFLVWNFGHLLQIVGASDDQAPFRQQPWTQA